MMSLRWGKGSSLLCVTAKARRATDATLTVLMDLTVFDTYAEAKGALDDQAKADLIEVDRVTLWRYRTGRLTPSLGRAMSIARTLGCDFDALFPRAAS